MSTSTQQKGLENANIEKPISATTKNTRNPKNFIVVDLSRCKDSNTIRSNGNLCPKFVIEIKSYNHTSEQHGIQNRTRHHG